MDHVVVFVPLTAPRFPLHLVSLLWGLTLSSLDIFYNLDHRDDGEGQKCLHGQVSGAGRTLRGYVCSVRMQS